MLLSTVVLLCCDTFFADTPRIAAESSAIVTRSSEDARPLAAVQPSLPDAPTAKVALAAKEGDSTPGDPGRVEPGSSSFVSAPIKPAVSGSYETARKRMIWYGLLATGHGAAAFDAWSTRRAVSGGYGTESNPMLRPFANSNAIYAATQISPAVMDFLGHRMMTSSHPWMRRFWWVPQAAGAGFSLGAGLHNYSLVP